jgi:hypothetical protein
VYSVQKFDEVRTAIADFSVYAQDPKAAILPSYSSMVAEGLFITQGIFYDGPTPPLGTFTNFTNILSVSSDLKTRSYADMFLSVDVNITADLR